ncbi:MAG: 3-oxoacyl-[acyl-carrier-protein] synthase III C-terminal domain-containing protein [Candidatus Omnitrophota bacterium]
MTPRITSISTANPPLRMDQSAIIDLIMKQDFSVRSKKYYERFMSDDGVRSRTFAIDRMERILTEDADAATARFETQATALAVEAGRKSLAAAGLRPDQVDGLVIVTCTGYLCPGLTSYVGEALGVRKDVFILDIVGHGCGAAVPGLRVAEQFLLAAKKGNLLFIAVEICSATFVHAESVDLLLSNSIFGDGAAACVLTCDEKPGWQMIQHGCLLFPETRDQLRFRTVNARLQNVLGKAVPQFVSAGVKALLTEMTIARLPEVLVFHPGGRLILDRIEETLGLAPEALKVSRHILAEYGNMSSPSVMYILKHLAETQVFSDGTPALMVSYGAGTSVNGALLRWTEKS